MSAERDARWKLRGLYAITPEERETDCLCDYDYLLHCKNPLYLGMDIGRRKDLTVIDVGELIGIK